MHSLLYFFLFLFFAEGENLNGPTLVSAKRNVSKPVTSLYKAWQILTVHLVIQVFEFFPLVFSFLLVTVRVVAGVSTHLISCC